MYVLHLNHIDSGKAKWEEVPMPVFEPYVDNEGIAYTQDMIRDPKLNGGDTEDPFAVLLRNDNTAASNRTDSRPTLRLLGGSASWVTGDARYIYFIGGCVRDRTGREIFLYGNVQRVSDDTSQCILRNVVRMSLDLNGKNGLQRGTFSVLPQRCMGARKYSSMVGSVAVNATQQLVIYGGQ
jgi:hypothetical protein